MLESRLSLLARNLLLFIRLCGEVKPPSLEFFQSFQIRLWKALITIKTCIECLDSVHNPSSPRSPISSSSSVSHLSPTFQTSTESSNGQSSPVSTTSIPTPPPPPPITWQRPTNLCQNPKQRVPYNPSANHVTVLSTTITEPTSFTVANNSPEWHQAMKEKYDALIKNGMWSLVTRASNTNVVDCNNNGTIDNIISQLESAFALKDLRPLNYFLGIEIVSHVSDILLSQKKHILELLQSVGLSNCNPVSSPMVTSSSLSLDDSTAFSNPVCQYTHAPTENHWSAVKRILCYLHGTIEHGMLIRRSSGSTLQAFTDVLWKGNPDNSLEAFSDADWAGDSDDRRSTGDLLYIFVQTLYLEPLANNVRFHSFTEAEYKALADTIVELTWLQALIHNLGAT
ncbi:retrovirus-related pol polyprotein from transposon TNT 1-94 [Tanacetum coccineum]